MKHWLDRYIAEQRQFAANHYGSPDAVSAAATATELFSEDDLEAFAASQGGSHD